MRALPTTTTTTLEETGFLCDLSDYYTTSKQQIIVCHASNCIEAQLLPDSSIDKIGKPGNEQLDKCSIKCSRAAVFKPVFKPVLSMLSWTTRSPMTNLVPAMFFLTCRLCLNQPVYPSGKQPVDLFFFYYFSNSSLNLGRALI
ncbi:hypothetical protein T4C_7350 [Trichinella pseudospiralis]|uniref:Uncharacterized protein n=1 Tax=Trichinella pseudospiralis TaxID=6337 RepID=A0A0V1K4T8_TRIPS|nr:hypothetical protein T4C_7350 [Trichinella pseudospiralis]